LQIRVVMVRVDQNNNPVQESQEFQSGETVGAVAEWVSIPQDIPMNYIWLQLLGDRAQPVSNPVPFTAKPEFTGKHTVFTIGTRGAPAGDYGFLIFVKGSGEQIQGVASTRFRIR
jgi:hypothetical protein